MVDKQTLMTLNGLVPDDNMPEVIAILDRIVQEARLNVLENLPITGIIGMNGRRTDCVLADKIYEAIQIEKTINELKAKR